ncbi:MAG: prepilin-type N-terminal cleavage/methylation domain-containing protein [Arcobacteraceae bacterium]|jgi:prepilin-type N-terminal cleavage/methylation domain-containing protein|nr:prepilin-type N-terminal cleavage/methylation domain-containing protein [Arcobacteraceae bacterium]
MKNVGKKGLKRGFTLLEVMISVALFSIIIVFLYHTIDINAKSNQLYEEKLSGYKSQDDVKFILYEDIFGNTSVDANTTTLNDKNNNTILHLKTDNTFHNPFFNHITYFLGKDGELFRIESKEYFNGEKVYEMLKDSYVDIVLSGVEKFRVRQKGNENKFAVYIKFQNGEEFFLTVTSPR